MTEDFMHAEYGCHSCNYLLPGCTSCSAVKWNTGIALDADRLGTDTPFMTCNDCKGDERFVNINLDTSVKISGFDYAKADFTKLPD